MLGFNGDAIILSGETGTKLKSEILGKYYKKWWGITSGGKGKRYWNSTAIIEMNSATGEIYIKDSNETVLGSSGHALELLNDGLKTRYLKIILVEKNDDCFKHLRNVIKKRWPELSCGEFSSKEEKDVFLIQDPLQIEKILTKYELGNSLFFFDPLLSVEWKQIEHIAKKRIKNYYETGTEFLIFLFTSDFFIGRNEYDALPTNNNESLWSKKQLKTVRELDKLLGDTTWREYLLNSKSNDEKMKILVALYKKKLRRWFRYVLPLPFEPKKSQLYHIFFCSNFATGVELTKNFFIKLTNNSKVELQNEKAHKKFLDRHPEKRIKGRPRSSEWKILWAIIKNHEDGLCDKKCGDLLKIESTEEKLQCKLEWLESKKYLLETESCTTAWNDIPKLYELDWKFIKQTLNVSKPDELSPLPSGYKIQKPKKTGLDKYF